MNFFSKARFFTGLIAVLAISAFATLRSQVAPELVRNVELAGYGGLLLLALLGEISISKEAWLLALASAAQAIGGLSTGEPLDAIIPLQFALRTIVIVGLLPQLAGKTVNLRWVLLGLLALAAVNYYESQARYEIDLLADNRIFSNMIGGYGMLFCVTGFCLADWTGMALLTGGALILMVTSCRSAALGTLVGCGVSALLRYRQFDRKFIRFNLLALMCLPLIAYEGWHRLDAYGRDSMEMQIEHFLSPDMARSEKWDSIDTGNMQSILLGQGRYTANSEDTHNVWLSAYKAGGVLALLALIYAQFAVFRRLYAERVDFWAALSLAWFMAIVSRSMFEGGTGIFPATGMNWTAICTMFIVGIGLRFEPVVRTRPKRNRGKIFEKPEEVLL